MRPFCAAVDWGTSSFRLWLLAEDGTVLAERRSGEGMVQSGKVGFAAVLEAHLAAVRTPTALPVMICGMAGARQGWHEAGYLDVPADLDEIAAHAVSVSGIQRDVRILPGIAERDMSAPDVMRGEETQLLGLGHRTVKLVCMPGTHSKWVSLDRGSVTGFSTFMTGELFALMSERSILAHTMETDTASDAEGRVFVKALRSALDEPAALTSRLFGIRAGRLLGFASPETGKAHLSGLLIGTEIAAAKARHGISGEVTLIASGRLSSLYRTALREAGMTVSHVDADVAVRSGLLHAARSIWPREEGGYKA